MAVPVQRANPKLAAQTARRIEDDIIAAHWPVGQVLGSEAQLMERYDVSRAVLREAIRLIEHHGVARMRRGPDEALPVPRKKLGATALAAHRKIAAAVLDGDYALARHRMSRHLGGITAVKEL